ncbi:MAG: hypothetical protein ACJ74T_11010, partial [Pyrinomonadaceae bacterium]
AHGTAQELKANRMQRAQDVHTPSEGRDTIMATRIILVASGMLLTLTSWGMLMTLGWAPRKMSFIGPLLVAMGLSVSLISSDEMLGSFSAMRARDKAVLVLGVTAGVVLGFGNQYLMQHM